MSLQSLLLFLSLFLPSVLAQDPGSLSPCAITCITKQSNCVLATPECLCPHRQDIEICISQTCPISDLEDSLHAIDSFCQTITSTSTPTSSTTKTTSQPAVTLSSLTRSITTPSTSNTDHPTPIPASATPTTFTTISLISPTLSTPIPPPTTLTTSPPTTPSPSTTPSHAPQTVIIFSTQFPSSTPPTGNTSGATWNLVSTTHLAAPLLFAVFFSSLLDLI